MAMSRQDFLTLIQRAVELLNDGTTDEEYEKDERGELWDDNDQLNGGYYAAAERCAKEVGLPITQSEGDPVALAIYWRHSDADNDVALKLQDLMGHIDRAWAHVESLGK